MSRVSLDLLGGARTNHPKLGKSCHSYQQSEGLLREHMAQLRLVLPEERQYTTSRASMDAQEEVQS